MPHAFLAKLRRAGGLTEADEAVLRRSAEQVAQVEAGSILVRSGVRASKVQIIFDGLACRHKALPDGKAQILAILVPGDICNLQATLLGSLDHSVRTLTRCTVGTAPLSLVEDWTGRADINRALWRATMVDEAILRQWMLSLGVRSAEERIAHLFVELLHRLKAVGLATETGYALPITQEQLAECAGLSTVHVNRVLNRLREAGLVTMQRHRVAIADLPRLTAIAGFDLEYLHLAGRDRGERGSSPLERLE